MTDNVAVTPGTGATIATDDIGGVQYQRVKVTWGADGTANDADTASGKALPTQLRTSTGTEIDVAGQLGATSETAPGTDTATAGLNGRAQRIAQNLTTLNTTTGTTNTEIGATNETAASTDTATSGLNGRLQRAAQNLTTINTTIGTTNTEIGATNETAASTDTATAGLNGRLQRIAQRVTSLIALLPTSLGQKSKANGLAVTFASDVTVSVAVTPTVTASSAYAAGNEVGGLMTFASAVGAAGGAILQSVTVLCKSVQTGALRLYLFSANPTNTTWTNKTGPSINAADLPNLLCGYPLSGADNGLGTMTIWNLDGIGKSFNAAGTSLYGVLITDGTPTFGSTSDITVMITTLTD